MIEGLALRIFEWPIIALNAWDIYICLDEYIVTPTSNLYDDGQASNVPAEALLASLGCGNPTALAELKAGEIVLDLGSGGGIDVLLSAKRVGQSGKVYGLDMTDEMLALARENQSCCAQTCCV